MISDSGWSTNRKSPTKGCREDRLNRVSFVNYIVDIISNTSADNRSSIVAINGKWGEGKTSVKNMILENMD